MLDNEYPSIFVALLGYGNHFTKLLGSFWGYLLFFVRWFI